MNHETHELIALEYGIGVRYSTAQKLDDRAMAGYDNLAEVVQSHLRLLTEDEEANGVDRDFLAALLDSIKPHDWRMLAIGLFNAKENPA